MFRKLILVLAALSSGIQGIQADCCKPTACEDATDVYTQTPGYTFLLEARALFLRPTASNLSYGAEAVPLPLPSPRWVMHDVAPCIEPAFDIGFQWHFHNPHSVLMFNWERFKSCNSNSTNVGTDNMIGPYFEIGPDASAYQLATGTADFLFNEINVDYGQRIQVGQRLLLTPYAGVSFVGIKEHRTAFFSNTDATITRTILSPICFKGAGPQLGIDFNYDIWCGIKLNGRAYTSLLAGKIQSGEEYLAEAPELQAVGVTPPNRQSTATPCRKQVVPAFQERIGLSYERTFCECYFAKLEVGYQAQVYLDALQSTDIGSEVNTPPVIPDTIGVFARTFQNKSSNFALTGPYLTLDLAF